MLKHILKLLVEYYTTNEFFIKAINKIKVSNELNFPCIYNGLNRILLFCYIYLPYLRCRKLAPQEDKMV